MMICDTSIEEIQVIQTSMSSSKKAEEVNKTDVLETEDRERDQKYSFHQLRNSWMNFKAVAET